MAAFTTAVASTWGDTWSSEAAQRRISSGDEPSGVTMVATLGWPAVSVPVLSNSSVRHLAIRSSVPPPFTITPRFAARDRPATNATGAARMSGQGVATTRTATARARPPDSTAARVAATRATIRNHSA